VTLSQDVDRLGRVLGAVLREQGGDAFFALVEEVRTATKALRERGEDTSVLQARLGALDLGAAEGLVRAFSLYFQLVNLAEEAERVRRVREREGPRKQGLEEALAALRARGLDAAGVRALLERVSLGLTFTAHPTEMRRRTVREHLDAIGAALPALDDDPRALARITARVEALWGTLELRHARPTVRDEVNGGLAYVEVIAEVLPELSRELDACFVRVYGEDARPHLPLPLPLWLCSWMGGDRDGNPNVTPEVTRETLALHHERAVALLRDAVGRAFAALSQHAARVPFPGALPPGAAEDRADEPWRALLAGAHRGLGRSPAVDPTPALAEVERSLRAAGQRRCADELARPLVVLGAALGTHLVSLDVREHSEKTGRAVAALLAHAGVADYLGLDEDARVRVLREELRTRRPLLPVGEAAPPEVRLVVEPLVAVREAMRDVGPRAFGRYVVSMSESVSDLLEVLVLAREAGARVLPVPLFETREDLARAPVILREALALPELREALAGDVQEVMIGYSDSNKDAGFLAANWALHEAQRGMAAVCREAGVRWRFFHGRGTSIGRGGGPMARAILGQPPGTIGAGLRITEQGEALADKYSHPALAFRNLEQGLHALLLAAATEDAPLPPEWSEAMGRAADRAAEAYRALIEHPRFVAFFEAVTPIREIARLKIASRPVRRPGPSTLATLRAIPWVMSWTQNRANLPGWYGLHEGLAELPLPLARRMLREWPFFRSMLDNAQMSLAKSDAAIFRAYLALAPDEPELGARLLDARAATIARIEEITEAPLLSAEPRLLRSIQLRNPYIEPIHRLQVELLRRARAAGDALEPPLERALLLSIHGIAAGVRNTG
jgi:phosphoenolpyruvate carboxylase